MGECSPEKVNVGGSPLFLAIMFSMIYMQPLNNEVGANNCG